MLGRVVGDRVCLTGLDSVQKAEAHLVLAHTVICRRFVRLGQSRVLTTIAPTTCKSGELRGDTMWPVGWRVAAQCNLE
eukprot:scaffold188288_cov40-Prasinocladus_malaysianus.AAC.1